MSHLKVLTPTATATILAVVPEDTARNRSARHYLWHGSLLTDLGAGTATCQLYGCDPTPRAQIVSYTLASPSVITTDEAHGLIVGNIGFVVNDDGDLTDGAYVVASVPSTTTLTFTALNSAGGQAAPTTGRIHFGRQLVTVTSYLQNVPYLEKGVGPFIGFYALIGASSQVMFYYSEV